MAAHRRVLNPPRVDWILDMVSRIARDTTVAHQGGW